MFFHSCSVLDQRRPFVDGRDLVVARHFILRIQLGCYQTGGHFRRFLLLTAFPLREDEWVRSHVNFLLLDDLLLPREFQSLDLRIGQLVHIQIGHLVANRVCWRREQTLLALTEQAPVLQLLLFVHFGLVQRLLEEKGVDDLGPVRERRCGEAASMVIAGVVRLLFGLACGWGLEVAGEDVSRNVVL